MAATLVLDLSSNNAAPDWKSLKANGVSGVWIKATEGITYTDPFFAKWRAAATAAGLRVGAYHFARPDSNASAVGEAERFAAVVGKVGRTDLRPVLDYERRHGGGEDEHWIRVWNQAVKKQIGVGPLFYSYPALINDLKLNSTVGYGLWLADYGVDDGQSHTTVVPGPWKKLVAHQYTSRGRVGSYGPVDKTEIVSLRAVLAHPVVGRL